MASRTGALRFTTQQNVLEDNVARAGAYYSTVIENKVDFSGCVVLHVGPGSGVLALCAAKAGAKRVYLVEPSEYTLRLISENPTFSELITLIKGDVKDLNLPEKVDVIMSEPLGMCSTHGFNERGLKCYVTARDRFLGLNGKLFPSAGRINIAPFSDEILFTEMASKPVLDAFDESVLVAPPVIHSLDFTQNTEEDLYAMELPLLFVSSSSTVVHGVAMWSEVLLGGSVENKWIQTSPGAIPANCFRIRCVFPHPIHLAIGQTISGKARFVAVTDQSYTIDITLTAERFGRAGSMIRFQHSESKFNLCEVEQLPVIPRAPKAQDKLEEWNSQFEKGVKDEFRGVFLPYNLIESFDSANDASSVVVAILVGTEKNRVSHIMLPPQWTTEEELNISTIPMDDMHLKGTTLIGYLRSGAPGKTNLPTAADVAFLTKHFGPEAVVGICSTTSSTGTSTLALYKLSKEGFKKTSWTLDEKVSTLFLVPRGDKWNYNTVNSSMKNMPFGLWRYNTCVGNTMKNMPYSLKVVSRLRRKNM